MQKNQHLSRSVTRGNQIVGKFASAIFHMEDYSVESIWEYLDDVPPSSVDQFLRLRERLVSSDESLDNLDNLDAPDEEKKVLHSLKKERKFSRHSKEKLFKMNAKKLKQEYMFFYDSHYARRFCGKFFASPHDQDLCVGCGFTRWEHVKVSRFLHLNYFSMMFIVSGKLGEFQITRVFHNSQKSC